MNHLDKYEQNRKLFLGSSSPQKSPLSVYVLRDSASGPLRVHQTMLSDARCSSKSAVLKILLIDQVS